MSGGPAGLTVRETARRLGVHENTVRNWENRGLLRAVKLPGSGYRRFDPAEVERLHASLLSSQLQAARLARSRCPWSDSAPAGLCDAAEEWGIDRLADVFARAHGRARDHNDGSGRCRVCGGPIDLETWLDEQDAAKRTGPLE